MPRSALTRGFCCILKDSGRFPRTFLVASESDVRIPLTCSLGCFTKHFIEKIGYKMVLRQPTSRQQVGTLYEMTSPSSLWNASPQTTRVQKHAARHRATNQSFRLSTNARARVGGTPTRSASRPTRCITQWGCYNRETQREKSHGENDAKWEMSLL